jgi:hypothetical protein
MTTRTYYYVDDRGNHCDVDSGHVTQHSDGWWYDDHGHQCHPALDGIVEGTAGNDVIDYNYTGDPQGDRIDHNDQILPGAHANDDLVYAYGGNDTVLAGEGSDTVFGGDGNDSVNGGNGNDTLYGDAGNDTLAGGAGNNLLYGGAGDDRFIGGAGSDTFDGGTGQDNLDYSASGAGVTVNLSTNTLSGGDATNDHIAGGIDGAYGSNYADSLTGFDGENYGTSDAYTNQFYGNGGNDTISGLGGNDQLYGGNDQDLIYGGTGDDTVSGDAGNDTVYGDAGNDHVYGGDGNDLMYGGEGNDSIYGGATGNDSLSGGNDADHFFGCHAGQTVDGGEGGYDHDTFDLTGAGPLHIIYDPANPENGTVNFFDPTDHHITGTMTFTNIENVTPCFTPGTLIATPRGEVAVENLRPGDRIITRDNGMQEIAWVGRRDLGWADLVSASHLKPILVQAGSLGHDLPERDMMVSPNHRLLVANDRTALYFDEHEVLVAAKHLISGQGVQAIDAAGISYIHFMCERHEVVLSNGAWTETFQPGDFTLKGMGNAQRSEIFDLFPELKTVTGLENYSAARKTLKRHEAALLVR